MPENDSPSIYEIIGARLQMIREAVGLSQRDLAKKLGVSYNKIHNLEQGLTRMQIGDLYEIAEALDIQPLLLLKDTPPLADLRTFFKITFPEISEPTQVLDEMESLVLWSKRRWQIKANMPYQPMLYRGPSTLPQEFEQGWHNPILSQGNRYLYVCKHKEGLRGLFLESKIIPSDSPLESDTPSIRDSMWWNSKQELARFLAEQGYCWQFYPADIHYSEYCSPEHKAEIEAQRRP